MTKSGGEFGSQTRCTSEGDIGATSEGQEDICRSTVSNSCIAGGSAADGEDVGCLSCRTEGIRDSTKVDDGTSVCSDTKSNVGLHIGRARQVDAVGTRICVPEVGRTAGVSDALGEVEGVSTSSTEEANSIGANHNSTGEDVSAGISVDFCSIKGGVSEGDRVACSTGTHSGAT